MYDHEKYLILLGFTLFYYGKRAQLKIKLICLILRIFYFDKFSKENFDSVFVT